MEGNSKGPYPWISLEPRNLSPVEKGVPINQQSAAHLCPRVVIGIVRVVEHFFNLLALRFLFVFRDDKTCHGRFQS